MCAKVSVNIIDFAMRLPAVMVNELLLFFFKSHGIQVVESSSEDASESCASYIDWQVVEENILRVDGIVPVHENGLAYCQGWVEAWSCEPAYIAEGPEVEADSGYTVHTKIRCNSFLSCDMEDQKHEHKRAHDFHSKGAPVLFKAICCKIFGIGSQFCVT